MPFTAQELENIANAAIDYHYNTPNVRSQSLQNKPLLDAMMSAKKTFPGGKENITFGVKGEYNSYMQGFSADGTVTYGNPANMKRGSAPWKLLHFGLEMTMHELAKDGISIVDTSDGSGERRHSDREMTALANILQDKLEDFSEGSDRDMNLMFWRDGTQDSDLVPGIRSFIVDDPTAASVVLGVDQSANTWWRNRASLALTASTASDQNVINTLQGEWRQLRRYGGKPNLVLAGSDFIEWVEKELRSKGNYTQDGWNSRGKTDAGMADIAFKGTTFTYDPTLDDESLAKYCFVLDTRTILPMVMDGEDMKDHRPARPENKYVFYRAKTWIGGLICNQRNANGVYSIA